MNDQSKHTACAQRLFYPEEGIDLPFEVANRPGVVVIILDPKAMQAALMTDPRSHRWIHGARDRVVVDLSRIQMINSSICGWLTDQVRSAKPAAVSITGANKRVAGTLHMLGLDSLMKVDG